MDYEPANNAAGGANGNASTIDDASMHTITATSMQSPVHVQTQMPMQTQMPIQTMQPPMAAPIHSPQPPQPSSFDPQSRPQTSYSDTGFTRSYAHSESATTPDAMQHDNALSRPPSTQSGSGQYGADSQRQQGQKNPSVVIKVGMVGDAQIGKTSLMVKYVEGSWDEDYIQTLGKSLHTRHSEWDTISAQG